MNLLINFHHFFISCLSLHSNSKFLFLQLLPPERTKQNNPVPILTQFTQEQRVKPALLEFSLYVIQMNCIIYLHRKVENNLYNLECGKEANKQAEVKNIKSHQ